MPVGSELGRAFRDERFRKILEIRQ